MKNSQNQKNRREIILLLQYCLIQDTLNASTTLEITITCKADEQRFITHYRKVLSKELASRQKEFDNHYNDVELGVRALMNSGEYEVVRFEHINAFVDQADAEIKVNEICNKTFFGKFVIDEVKLKQSNAIVREVWALKIPVSMICSLEEMYMSCSNRCGYIY